MTDPTRQPRGIPAGGQFAPHDRGDADVSLAAAPERRYFIGLGGGRYAEDDKGRRLTFTRGIDCQKYAAAHRIGRFIQEQVPTDWEGAELPVDDVALTVDARETERNALIAETPQLAAQLALNPDTAYSLRWARNQVDDRSGAQEIGDVAAVALLDSLGDDYPAAAAAARGLPTQKADVWLDLRRAYADPYTTPRTRSDIDALYTWLLHGPDTETELTR